LKQTISCESLLLNLDLPYTDLLHITCPQLVRLQLQLHKLIIQLYSLAGVSTAVALLAIALHGFQVSFDGLQQTHHTIKQPERLPSCAGVAMMHKQGVYALHSP
jgi:hypothetical protein